MAITTLDGLIAGFTPPINFRKVGAAMEAAGVMHSMLYSSGEPGAAVAPTSAIGGDALTTYAGQLSFTNPSSGNSYLASLSVEATAVGTLLIADRLWHNSSMDETQTTAQTITSATWPARDVNGTTNGAGVMVGIEVSTATSNGGAVTNTTMEYTNSAGTTTRTATISSFPATAVAGTFVPFQLQAGDLGVRSIQSLTFGTSYGTGVCHLVAYRVLARIPVFTANVGQLMDFAGTGMPRMYDNTVPFLIWQAAATNAVTLSGSMIVAQG